MKRMAAAGLMPADPGAAKALEQLAPTLCAPKDWIRQCP